MKNIGKTDQKIRLVLAALLALTALELGQMLACILFTIALVLVFTAWFHFCPLWKILGIHTTPSRK